MKKTYSKIKQLAVCFLLSLAVFQNVYAQENSNSIIEVKGIVKDNKGLPIIGANVGVKGGKGGVITDFDGNYIIKVAQDGVLVFSFIGFKNSEIQVKGRSVINVVLEDNIASLDEVVIVGTTMKKGDLTGAVVNVKEKTLKERPVTSINEALQGRAAGVFIQTSPTPGGNAGIRIRGNNSIQYGGNPIFVVDGIIMDNDFNLINLNDVASIDVLKDASATALYGSRGANGVVVVTTKKVKRELER